jgi:hypothetical protein
MDMDSAAAFLAGSILYALGFIVILICVVVCNNIIHKFWKSFGWTFTPHWMTDHSRFMTEEEVRNAKPGEERNENSKSK